MAFSYDPTTPRGLVRLIIADSNEAGHVFEDNELDAFLALNEDRTRLAAADALETMASNESMVQKAIKLLDLQTDGSKTAADLRKAAAVQRAIAAVELEALDSGFTLAEYPQTTWGVREYAWNEALRSA